MLSLFHQPLRLHVRLIAASLKLCLLALPAFATQMISGKVIAVADGDTLTIIDDRSQQRKIRISGIDAPESSQAFGDKAKKSLSDLVFGETIAVVSSKTDRYGRLVGKVALDDRDIGLEQIRRGLAWFFRQYASELSRDDARAYEQAENEAREKRRGLWSEPGPIPPWELRAAQRNESSSGSRQPMVLLEGKPVQTRIIGNRNSMIYHAPNCPDYEKVSERNREYFKTEKEAAAAGYRKARNCPQ